MPSRVASEPAAFDLEIDEADADAEEQASKEIIDANGQSHDVVDFLRRRPAESGDMLFGDERIVQRIVLVIKFDDRARQLSAFLDAEARRQGARGDVANNDFERNDLHFANQLLAHVEPANEMGRHADIVQILKQIFGNPVIQHALAVDNLVFLGVERRGVVLEALNERSGLGTFIKNFGLAFVNGAAAVHGQ